MRAAWLRRRNASIWSLRLPQAAAPEWQAELEVARLT
jgi:hypothetical protein